MLSNSPPVMYLWQCLQMKYDLLVEGDLYLYVSLSSPKHFLAALDSSVVPKIQRRCQPTRQTGQGLGPVGPGMSVTYMGNVHGGWKQTTIMKLHLRGDIEANVGEAKCLVRSKQWACMQEDKKMEKLGREEEFRSKSEEAKELSADRIRKTKSFFLCFFFFMPDIMCANG